MKNYLIAGAAAAALCAVSAFIGWCSGYNFDYRSMGVAMWMFNTLLAAFGVFCGVRACQ